MITILLIVDITMQIPDLNAKDLNTFGLGLKKIIELTDAKDPRIVGIELKPGLWRFPSGDFGHIENIVACLPLSRLFVGEPVKVDCWQLKYSKLYKSDITIANTYNDSHFEEKIAKFINEHTENDCSIIIMSQESISRSPIMQNLMCNPILRCYTARFRHFI